MTNSKRGRFFLLGVLTVTLLFPLFFQGVAQAAGGEAANDVAADKLAKVLSLTDRIIDEELALLSHNTNFRIETNDQSKGRSMRQFLYNLTASGVSLASATTITAHRWANTRPDQKLLEVSAAGLVTGQAIIQGGIVTEKVLDMIQERRAGRRGYSLKEATATTEEFKTKIDALLRQRDEQIASLDPAAYSSATMKAVSAETLVLFELRNLSLAEFARFYADQRKRKSSRDNSYLNGLLATSAGGYGGSLMGLLATSRGQPSLTVPAGIGFITSSALVMASPVVNRFVGRRAHRKGALEIRARLGEISESSLLALDGSLNDLAVKSKQSVLPGYSQRMAIYAAECDVLRKQLEREKQVETKSDSQFKKRMVANAIISGPKLAWGVMLITAGDGFENRPVRFNERVAEAATVYTVSHSAWLLDTVTSGSTPGSLKFTIGGQVPFEVKDLEYRLGKLEELKALKVRSISDK